MYNTTVRNPIYLVHREDGIVRTFKSFDSLVYHWASIACLDIGPTFKITWKHDDWLQEVYRLRGNAWPACYHDYILRTSIGDNIDPADVRAAHRKAHPYRSRWNRHSGSKRGSYRWHRRIRTTQERRWTHAWEDEEFAPKVRNRRNAHNLANAWDDRVRSNDRNWKRHRANQWK